MVSKETATSVRSEMESNYLGQTITRQLFASCNSTNNAELSYKRVWSLYLRQHSVGNAHTRFAALITTSRTAATCPHSLGKRLGSVGKYLCTQRRLHVALGVVVARHRREHQLPVTEAGVQEPEVQGRHGVRRPTASFATVRLFLFQVLL